MTVLVDERLARGRDIRRISRMFICIHARRPFAGLNHRRNYGDRLIYHVHSVCVCVYNPGPVIEKLDNNSRMPTCCRVI